MAKEEVIVDLSDAEMREMVKTAIGSKRGLWWFGLRRCRDQRTLSQNAYLWGVVYPRIAQGMAEAWGEAIGSYGAHEFLKEKYLQFPIVNPETGEVRGHSAPSTADLDKAEFGQYVDKVIRFALEQLNVIVPPPEKYRVRDPRAADANAD